MASAFRKDPSAEYAQPLSFNAPRPITAAAARIKLDDKTEADQFKSRRGSVTSQWQSASWEYYDAIGEIKYAFNLVASVVSRIRLYAATVEDPAESPTPIRLAKTMDPDLADAAERGLARLDSAYGGQAGLLRDAALNLSVAGECYLVQVPPRYGVAESWDIRSVDELQVDNKGNYIIAPRRDLVASGSSQAKPGMIPLPPDAFVGRLWRAHPRYSEEPDSSMKGILDLCDELLLLNRSFRATERSRLNAGMIYIPDGLSTASTPDPDLFTDEEDPVQQTPEEAADQFEDEFINAMVTPVEDESSANAVAPLVVRGPAELGDKIKQFSFNRAFDEAHNARSDRVLERILQGLDVPKDTVTGLANVKYSNAIQIDEALYKAHIEPMLLLISDAITVVFLRPYLRSIGYSEQDVNRIVVWYDPSAVATRNDRAADADSGYEKMAISADTWRRQHGFSDADAPTPNEVVLRLIQNSPTMTPELFESLLTVVAPDIMGAVKAAQQAASVAPIPGNVQNVLSGGTGDATAAPDGSAAPATDDGTDPGTGAPDASADPSQGATVEPGDDAPPFPLAEPDNS